MRHRYHHPGGRSPYDSFDAVVPNEIMPFTPQSHHSAMVESFRSVDAAQTDKSGRRMSTTSDDPGQYDVFITHSWIKDELGRDNHKRCQAINDGLKAKGVVTWFDSDKMIGHIKQKITEGIDNSSTVLVCLTRAYHDKVWATDAIQAL